MKNVMTMAALLAMNSVVIAQTNVSPLIEAEEVSRQIEAADVSCSTFEVIVRPERVVSFSDGSTRREVMSAGGGGYRKLGTGLLCEDADGLKPSSLTPVVSASGVISFPDAPQSISFAANANRETVVETRRHDQPIPARSAVAALAYYDAASQTRVVVANVAEAAPIALTDGVVYENTFDAVLADIVYKVHPWGLEQDVVILGDLPHPDVYKLDPASTYLCVLTELIGLDPVPQSFHRSEETGSGESAASPMQIYKQVNGEPILLHDFQRGMAYDSDTALVMGGAEPAGETIPVKHRVIEVDGRWFLSEEAPVAEILKRTPEIFTVETGEKAFSAIPKTRPSEVAAADEITRPVDGLSGYSPRSRPYFVMDYLDYSGTKSNDVTLASGETYFISSDLVMNGSVLSIKPGAIVKYATNATIKLINNATIKSYSHLMNPAIFTTVHDTNFGQAISGYTNNPASNLFVAAFTLAGTSNTTVQGVRIRYAKTGIKVETSGHTLIHNRIEKGWQGVEVNSASTGGFVEVRNTLFHELSRGVTAGAASSNLWLNLLNCTMDTVTEYGVATNTRINAFAIRCTLFASVTNQTVKDNPTGGYDSYKNAVFNSPTQGLGTVVVITNSPFKTGAYGSHYLDQSSSLVDGGYITPAYWQLSYYSTATNHQEDAGTVDIGFHYPATNDVDSDGLFDFREATYGTSRTIADTDGDGLLDGAEVDTYGSNPLLPDSDGDGLTDGSEINTHNTNPLNNDTDGDGLPDGWEVENGFDPRSGLSNLVGWWKLDETTGTTASDSSSNINHGTVQNSSYAWWTNGMVNNGIKLNGTNSYIQLSDSSALRPTNVSVSAWIRPDKTYSNGYAIFFSKEQPGYAGGYNLRYFEGELAFLITSYGYYHSASVVTTLQAGTWYHVAGTYDGSKHRLFVNGQKIVDVNRSVTLYHTTVSPRIGATPDWTPISHFNGIIDDVRVFNTGLGTNAVVALLDASNDSDGDDLTNLEEFQEGTDPNYGDTDDDGLLDGEEVNSYGTDPLDSDTDGDELSDGDEVTFGTDPTNATSFVVSISGLTSYTGDITGAVHIVVVAPSYTNLIVRPTPGAFTIHNLPTLANYSLSAWMDYTSDGTQDTWEAAGSFAGNPLYLTSGVSGVSITLYESDTDEDGIPDWWEIEYGLNPSSGIHGAMAGWWKFDEMQGTTVHDSSPSGKNGQMIDLSTNAWVAGWISGAIQFNGTNGYVRIPQPTTTLTGQPFTVTALSYYDPSAPDNFPTLISDLDAFGTGGYSGMWLGYDQGPPGPEAYVGNNAGDVWIYDTGSITGRWAIISMVYDKTNLSLYVDGRRVNVASATNMTASAVTNIYIGWANHSDFSSRWKGKIDDVRVYSSALSSNAIYTLYDALQDADTDGLTNLEEYQRGTRPDAWDTDEDDLSDFEEVNIHGTDPLAVDTDGDGLDDDEEIDTYSTEPLEWDSDGDLLMDGREIGIYFTSPTKWDSTEGVEGVSDALQKYAGGYGSGSDYAFTGYDFPGGCLRWKLEPTVTTMAYDFYGFDYDEEFNVYFFLLEPSIPGTSGYTYMMDCDFVAPYYYSGVASDIDNDGLSDAYECLVIGTSPDKPDTDDNGIWDKNEDFDGDGLMNDQEYWQLTNPFNPDTDDDGVSDGPLDPDNAGSIVMGVDTFPLDAAALKDTDMDGMPDSLSGYSSTGLTEDADDDNDGYPDTMDSQPTIPIVVARSKAVTVLNAVDGGVYSGGYSSMAYAGTYNSWNPAGNMYLAANNVWKYVNYINDAVPGRAFKYAANGSWTVNWGDNNASGTSIPLSGVAESSGNDISMAGSTINGYYVVTFNDSTRAYSMTVAQADSGTEKFDVSSAGRMLPYASGSTAKGFGTLHGGIYFNNDGTYLYIGVAGFEKAGANTLMLFLDADGASSGVSSLSAITTGPDALATADNLGFGSGFVPEVALLLGNRYADGKNFPSMGRGQGVYTLSGSVASDFVGLSSSAISQWGDRYTDSANGGIEIKLPLSSLGLTVGDTVKVAGIVAGGASSGNTWFSGEAYGASASGTLAPNDFQNTPVTLLGADVYISSETAPSYASSIPATGDDVMLQGYYWDVPFQIVQESGDYLTDGGWYDEIRAKAENNELSKFSMIWMPPPQKGAAGTCATSPGCPLSEVINWDNGYGPFDYYDLGRYNEKFSVETRYGSELELQKCNQTLKGKGILPIVDLVLNHNDGGYTSKYNFQYGNHNTFEKLDPGAEDNENGYYNGGTAFTPFHSEENFGRDVNQAHPYQRMGMKDWGNWALNWAGYQGCRFDVAFYIDPWFISEFMRHGSMAGTFSVLEYWLNETEGTEQEMLTWLALTDYTSMMFDMPMNHQLSEMCNLAGSAFDMTELTKNGLVNFAPEYAVSYVESHDTIRPYASDNKDGIFKDKDMAYAFILMAEAVPMIAYNDYFIGINADKEQPDDPVDDGWTGGTLKEEIDQLIDIRTNFAGGDTAYLYAESDLLIMKRGGDANKPGCILVLNDNDTTIKSASVSAGFGSAVVLADALNPSHTKTTDGSGNVTLEAPPRGYRIYVRQSDL